ncbi:MAG: hypothetical protein HN396_12740 [Gemmatimonadales bacterium]|nr:hypothetical protein [Gemmatimonadales bacterium]
MNVARVVDGRGAVDVRSAPHDPRADDRVRCHQDAALGEQLCAARITSHVSDASHTIRQIEIQDCLIGVGVSVHIPEPRDDMTTGSINDRRLRGHVDAVRGPHLLDSSVLHQQSLVALRLWSRPVNHGGVDDRERG